MEFVMIVIVATLAAATPVDSPQPTQSSAQRHFADQFACEQAASTATPPLGTKLVCLPAGGGGIIHAAH